MRSCDQKTAKETKRRTGECVRYPGPTKIVHGALTGLKSGEKRGGVATAPPAVAGGAPAPGGASVII